LAGLLDATRSGVDLERFARVMNLTPERALQAREAAKAVVLGKEPAVAVSRPFLEALQSKILQSLRAFHAENPQAPAMAYAALHAAAAPALSAASLQAVLREMAARGAILVANDTARLAGHDETSNPADQATWDKVRAELARAGAVAPTIAELAAAIGAKDAALRDFLHRKAKGGEVVKVGTDRFYLRATMDQFAQAARAVAGAAANGFLTPAQFRDATGTTRAIAIPVLEALDRMGVTQRVGDNRRVKP